MGFHSGENGKASVVFYNAKPSEVLEKLQRYNAKIREARLDKELYQSGTDLMKAKIIGLRVTITEKKEKE